ncbi:MAG TPA: DUF2177 family protein [Longimicrobiales bacterium]|nr:DUF2177 family protein [Longimicrobiales bacterium]
MAGFPQLLKLYGLTAVVFFAVDLVWLGVVASGFYQKHLGHLLRPDVVWPAALLFYAMYLVGVLVFAVMPGLAAGSLGRAVVLGGFFGLVAYATFDLTCLALFADFPVIVVVVDLAWGLVLTAGVSAAGFGLGRWLGLP